MFFFFFFVHPIKNSPLTGEIKENVFFLFTTRPRNRFFCFPFCCVRFSLNDDE